MMLLRLVPFLFAAQPHMFKSQSLSTALEEYDRALRTLKYDYGTKPNEKVANVLKEVGDVFFDAGKVGEAKMKYNEALDMMKQVYGEHGQNVNMAATYDSLGLVHGNLGDYEQAKSMYEEALMIKRGVYLDMDEDIQDMTKSLHEITSGDLESYEVMIGKYMKTIKHQDEKNMDLVNTLRNLAHLHVKLGNKQHAQDLYKESLEILQKMCDSKLVNVATSLDNLAP